MAAKIPSLLESFVLKSNEFVATITGKTAEVKQYKKERQDIMNSYVTMDQDMMGSKRKTSSNISNVRETLDGADYDTKETYFDEKSGKVLTRTLSFNVSGEGVKEWLKTIKDAKPEDMGKYFAKGTNVDPKVAAMMNAGESKTPYGMPNFKVTLINKGIATDATDIEKQRYVGKAVKEFIENGRRFKMPKVDENGNQVSGSMQLSGELMPMFQNMLKQYDTKTEQINTSTMELSQLKTNFKTAQNEFKQQSALQEEQDTKLKKKREKTGFILGGVADAIGSIGAAYTSGRGLRH